MSDEIVRQEMELAEADIKKQLKSCVPLLLLALTVPIAAYNEMLLPNGEPSDIWFQRSGSIMVLFAVWMEYNLMKVNDHINPSGITISEQTALSKKYKSVFGATQYLVALFAISGTVVWGYGDFFK